MKASGISHSGVGLDEADSVAPFVVNSVRERLDFFGVWRLETSLVTLLASCKV